MIVYSSSFDVSRPDGPGVNEQLFVMSLSRLLGDHVLFVIPKPLGILPAAFPVSRCVYLPEVRGRSVSGWLRHQRAKFRALRRLERESRLELVVIRPDAVPIADLLFTRRSNVPVCTKNAHVSARARFTSGGLKGMLFRIHYAVLERLMRRAWMIDVVSEIHRKDIIRQLGRRPDQVTVTDNAVDTGQFVPMDKKSCRAALGLGRFNPLFGYVGNLAAERGGLELIRSLPMVLDEFPDAGVLIVEGDRKSAATLGKLAEASAVGERVVFRGPIPLTAVPNYIAALDVAVSFRADDGCSELKVRQYIASGRPVVASAMVNGFIETERLGSLVARDETAAVTLALKRWAAETMDPVLAEQLAARLAAYARENLDTDAANRLRLSQWRNALAVRSA